MSAEPIFAGCVWTESRPERRDLLETVLDEVRDDRRFNVHWYGSEDTAAPDVYDYFRTNATPFAGLSPSRAWLCLRRNVQTTLGSSRRSSAWIARAAAGWNLIKGTRLTGNAPQSRLMDDCTRKHLLALDRFLDSDSEWLLGLEDDAIAVDGWGERVARIAERLSGPSSRAVFVAASEGAGLTRTASDPEPDDLGLFAISPPSTRTACAYLMNRAAAQFFQDTLRSTGVRPDEGAGFDFLAGFMVLQSPVDVYWTEPPVFLHGSERNVDGLGSHRFDE